MYRPHIGNLIKKTEHEKRLTFHCNLNSSQQRQQNTIGHDEQPNHYT